MAEYIPLDDLPKEPDDDNDDDDDDDYRNHMVMDVISSTTRQIKPDDAVAETSFGGREYEKEGARPKTKSGYTQLPSEDIDEIERNKDEAWDNILKMCPRAKPNFLFKFNEWGKIEVAISRNDPKKVKWYYFSDSYGDVNKKITKNN